MKNYNEMANDVLRRIGDYESARRKKRTMSVKIAVSLGCLCMVTFVGVGVWKTGQRNTPIIQGNSIEQPSQINGSANNGAEEQMEAFNAIYLSQYSAGEFAADMHRPEGYSNNIGSTLAIKMSITNDVDYKFSVIVRMPENTNLKQLLENANKEVITQIDSEKAMTANITGEIDAAKKYYFLLTADQIHVLAKGGAKCYYVGSGKGNLNDMNWETKDGINAYCELIGDMYVTDDTNIEHSPDVSIG